MISRMWNLKTKQIDKENETKENRPLNTENKLVVASRELSGVEEKQRKVIKSILILMSTE